MFRLVFSFLLQLETNLNKTKRTRADLCLLEGYKVIWIKAGSVPGCSTTVGVLLEQRKKFTSLLEHVSCFFFYVAITIGSIVLE